MTNGITIIASFLVVAFTFPRVRGAFRVVFDSFAGHAGSAGFIGLAGLAGLVSHVGFFGFAGFAGLVGLAGCLPRPKRIPLGL